MMKSSFYSSIVVKFFESSGARTVLPMGVAVGDITPGIPKYPCMHDYYTLYMLSYMCRILKMQVSSKLGRHIAMPA
jgi:hypothetical protein